MKVKIGNTYHDSEKEPIMLELNSKEKQLIGDMGDQTHFCAFPDNSLAKDILEFMKESRRKCVFKEINCQFFNDGACTLDRVPTIGWHICNGETTPYVCFDSRP
jgi:hypothetical protein